MAEKTFGNEMMKWIRQLNNQMTMARNTLRLTDLNDLDE